MVQSFILYFCSFLVAVDLSIERLWARSVTVLQYLNLDMIMFFSKLSISSLRSMTAGLLWLADSRFETGKSEAIFSPDIKSAFVIMMMRMGI